MDQDIIKAKVEQFLKELGVPSFIVFGFKKDDTEFGIVYSHKDVPKNVAIKGMAWALHDFAQKSL